MMTALIVAKADQGVMIDWEDPEMGFGSILIKYNQDGTYTLDAEYLSIDKIIKILKAVEFAK